MTEESATKRSSLGHSRRMAGIMGALFLITVCVFAYRVSLTIPWFGVLATDIASHDWLTAQTLIHATYWYEEGPWNLRFGTFWCPNTVEFASLGERRLYCSFPPGYVLPIYLLSRLSGHAPTVSLVMGYNLFNHFWLAFILSVTVALCLMRLRFPTVATIAFSAVPIVLTLLLPGPLYFMQAAYFSHTAVLVPFALLVLLELLRDACDFTGKRKLLSIAQGLVTFCGLITDWLMIFVVASLIAKRLILREKGTSWRWLATDTVALWLGSAIALALFGLQLWSLDGLSCLWNRFMWRTGGLNFSTVSLDMSTQEAPPQVSFFGKFWLHRVPKSFHVFGLALIWAGMAAWIGLVAAAFFRSRRGRPVSPEITAVMALMGMFLLPCLGESYVLRQHCVQHEFMALKFILPLSTIPLALLPAVVLSFSRPAGYIEASEATNPPPLAGSFEYIATGLAVAALATAVLYVAADRGRFVRFFCAPDRLAEKAGKFIRENTSYEDLVFSPDFRESVGPQSFAYAMRPVHFASNWREICEKLLKLNKDAVINLFVSDTSKDGFIEGRTDLKALARDVRQSGNMRLYKIDGGVLGSHFCLDSKSP